MRSCSKRIAFIVTTKTTVVERSVARQPTPVCHCMHCVLLLFRFRCFVLRYGRLLLSAERALYRTTSMGMCLEAKELVRNNRTTNDRPNVCGQIFYFIKMRMKSKSNWISDMGRPVDIETRRQYRSDWGMRCYCHSSILNRSVRLKLRRKKSRHNSTGTISMAFLIL